MHADNKYGNVQKYETENRLARFFLERFLVKLVRLIQGLDIKTIIDIGCGEGFICERVTGAIPHIRYTGIDIRSEAIQVAKMRVTSADFEVADIENYSYVPKSFDLVLSTEVLEHLPDPSASLQIAATIASKFALFTVPWEPSFRLIALARGRHLHRLGKDPEHLHCWTRHGFVKLVSKHFEIVKSHIVFPWTMVLCIPKE